MAENELKDQNILLVKKDNSPQLMAVANIDKNGNVETVAATPENADRFLKFDHNNREELAGILSDFNSGFMNGLDYQLFQVGYGSFEKDKEALEEMLPRPYYSQDREMLKAYAVDPKTFSSTMPYKSSRTVLLSRDENGKMKVVTGVDEKNGKLTTAAPIKENVGSFLQFDTNGNAIENFFKKFAEQIKHPSHTGFYAITANAVQKIAAFFERINKNNPDDFILDPYRVNNDGKLKEPEQGRFQPLDLNVVIRIDPAIGRHKKNRSGNWISRAIWLPLPQQQVI